MDGARLCRALQRSFSDEASGTDDTIGKSLLSKMARAYGNAADALEVDELERHGIVGRQPRGLMEAKPDA